MPVNTVIDAITFECADCDTTYTSFCPQALKRAHEEQANHEMKEVNYAHRP
jgi:hypothetical protein